VLRFKVSVERQNFLKLSEQNGRFLSVHNTRSECAVTILYRCVCLLFKYLFVIFHYVLCIYVCIQNILKDGNEDIELNWIELGGRYFNITVVLCLQYWSLLNWQNLRLRWGCVAVPVDCFFAIISSFFAKFKNDVQSLEPGETPSYSASHQAPNYVQRPLISQNTLTVALRLRLIFQFT